MKVVDGVSKQAAHQRWMTTYFDRYTKRARHIVTLAQERARDRGHGYIGTEHGIVPLAQSHVLSLI